ncbi:uncharacterized protein AruCF_0692 [Achromobacter ruhlandii]|nr:uncharacterized protein AruCF_0692 [Achromobacter ruhlandii]
MHCGNPPGACGAGFITILAPKIAAHYEDLRLGRYPGYP